MPEYLPTGTGLWSIATGLSALRTYDPVILFGNIGYTYNLSETFGRDAASASAGALLFFRCGSGPIRVCEIAAYVSEQSGIHRRDQTLLDIRLRRITGDEQIAAVFEFGMHATTDAARLQCIAVLHPLDDFLHRHRERGHRA